MSLLYQLDIQSVYDFAMRAGAQIGYSYKSATVLGLLDFASANQIEDVTPIHARIYADLPAGTPRNARDLVYVKIKTSTGDIRVFAMNWIASQPIQVTSNTVRATITGMSLSDMERLRQVLVGNGFINVTLEVVTDPVVPGV